MSGWDTANLPRDDGNNLPEPAPEEEKALAKLPDIEIPSTGGELLASIAQNVGVEIPADKMSVLELFMKKVKYGHQAALAMVCKGLSCPVINMCPLHAIEAELPVGKPCPVEGALIEQWVKLYTESLGIDPDKTEDAIDMHMIYEIAGLELMRTRAAHELSKNPAITLEKVVGFSPQGDPMYDDKPAIPLLVMEKQAKTIAKIRDQLLATRRSQAQAGMISNDISVRAANLSEKAAKILEQRNKDSARDAEFEVKNENTNS